MRGNLFKKAFADNLNALNATFTIDENIGNCREKQVLQEFKFR